MILCSSLALIFGLGTAAAGLAGHTILLSGELDLLFPPLKLEPEKSEGVVYVINSSVKRYR